MSHFDRGFVVPVWVAEWDAWVAAWCDRACRQFVPAAKADAGPVYCGTLPVLPRDPNRADGGDRPQE